MADNRKFNLITRSDFDGLVCALLFMHKEILNNVNFAHPKDMQDGKIKVSDDDISTNLPYVEGIHMAFDHHLSETVRNVKRDNHIIDPEAPSAARVVYDYYGGKEGFPDIPDEIMVAVDKADSAQFSKEEILDPKRYVLLNFIMDSRTGLGRFKDFRISNYQLMIDLILQSGAFSVDQIIEFPDVVERINLYKEHQEPAQKQLKELAKVHDNLLVLDFRETETIYATNRFTCYALYPDTNISIHILWGKDKKNIVFAIGKSIFKRDSKTSVGELCLKYEGGGHEAAGTCQVPESKAEEVLKELIAAITADG